MSIHPLKGRSALTRTKPNKFLEIFLVAWQRSEADSNYNALYFHSQATTTTTITMSLRVFNVAKRCCLLTFRRSNAVSTYGFRPEIQSRGVSFYNPDVAGLTDEEAEV